MAKSNQGPDPQSNKLAETLIQLQQALAESLEKTGKAAEGMFGQFLLGDAILLSLSKSTDLGTRGLEHMAIASMQAGMQAVAFRKVMSMSNTEVILFSKGLVDLNKKLSDHFYQLGENTDGTEYLTVGTKVLASSFFVATGAIAGFVAAGLKATLEGNYLKYQFQLVSQQIASVFLPVISATSRKLEGLYTWFRNLSGAQQDQLMWWGLAAVGALGALTVYVKLEKQIKALGATMKLLGANPLAVFIVGLAALMSQTEEGRAQLTEFGKTALDIFTAIGGMLSEFVAPILNVLNELIKTGTGKWLLFGAVGTLGIMKLISGLSALRVAMAGHPILQLLAIAGIIGTIGNALTGGHGPKQSEDLEKAARRGADLQKQLEENEIRRKEALEQNEKVGNQFGAGVQVRNMTPANRAVQINKEFDEAAKRINAAATKAGRRDVNPQVGGREDVRKTLERVEQAALNAQDPNERTAKASEGIWEMLRRFWGDKDNKPREPAQGP